MSFFWLKKWLFQWVSPLLLFNKKCANSFMNQKHFCLIYPWSDKAFQGTVVNPAMSSSHGREGGYAYLFIIATLKPRMELDITPVGPFLAEWYKVMFSSGLVCRGGGGGAFKWLSYLYLEVKYQGSLGEQDNCPSSLYAPPHLS